MECIASGKSKIILICGPTAIGKTSVAIDIAERIGGEIVGADSMQIYRFMDIGTAKPTAEEMRRVAHHMIDVADPDEPYDAARFSRESRAAVNAIMGRRRIPVIAGGTGFYIKALLYGLCEALPEDEAVRDRLREEALLSGGGVLYRRLEACDPDAAEKIHPNDTYRIVRALAVYETSGLPMSEYRRRHGFADAPYTVLKIGLFMDRQTLYARIDQRVEEMVRQGLGDEVKQLLAAGYRESLRPMQALGYRHMAAFIKGEADWDETIDTLKRDTRQYAKRQLTWFRKDPEIQWFEPEQGEAIVACARAFLRE